MVSSANVLASQAGAQMLEQGLSLQQVVNLPRYHQQSASVMEIEPNAFTSEVKAQLEVHGIELEDGFPPGSGIPIGRVNAVILNANQQFDGAADPRYPNSAAIIAVQPSSDASNHSNCKNNEIAKPTQVGFIH